MSVKKNGKRYRATFYFDGKRYECTGATQKEADKKAVLKEEQLKRGDIGISSKMTINRWAEEWLEIYKRPSVGEGQYANYRFYIDKVILPSLDNMKLSNIKDVHLQKIMNLRQGKSKSDVSRLCMIIKAIFKRAYQSRLIQFDPSENLELPAATEGTHRSITDVERANILELAETHYAGLWITTTLYTGIRPGEARALDWRHIDFKKKLLHVEQAMKSHTKNIAEPKSDAGVRDIPIPDVLLNAFLRNKKDPFEPVFKKEDRPYDKRESKERAFGRHDKASMERMWKSFKRELNIKMGAKVYRNKIIVSAVAEDLVPYCLRHTYCTDLQDAGVPINVARYLMGHADISTTAKIYTHTTDKALQDALEKINSMMVERMVEHPPKTIENT